MLSFYELVRSNRNYRLCWLGQVVSEVGDHFNTIAVLSLALELTGSGAAVGGVLIARTIPAILSAPVAGVVLDRMDRRKVMIASDVSRAVIALAFIPAAMYRQDWMLYVLSGLLMFASPFFTSGRSAILPSITRRDEVHTANALTQTTSSLTLTIGTMLGGISAIQFGYRWAFAANALSFVISALAIWGLRSPSGHFRAFRREIEEHQQHRGRGSQEFWESLRYMRQHPLILAIGLAGVGWASGGGAAQILFTLFGQVVYKRGPAGVGLIWGFAGIGLLLGGLLGHWLGRRLSYRQYLNVVGISFAIHGLAYVLFALGDLLNGLIFITISRMAHGSNGVLNRTALLTHVEDSYRGRVFATVEGMMNATMMLSLTVASVATTRYPIRSIGVVAGLLSASSAVFWMWAVWAGKLPEPQVREVLDEPVAADPITPA